ncbi:FxSxx-COOH system tetratricopeptide repeat protein [Micromonospora sp. NPDC007208]|uniref:FxSxx-COOH system tetratricopeptide repeat protein n=1 Tax=Micromonospora sp. NPDC007208 TaxID=3364236 RepID=UPI0036A45538
MTSPGNAAATGAKSAALRDNSGIVQTGDRARVIQTQVAALGRPQDVPVPAPKLIGLPKPPARSFVGREDELTKLATVMVTGSGVVAQSQAVHGLGGVGKSELALQYALRHIAEYSLVWWITADSPSSIEAGLADLAHRLHPESEYIAMNQESARWALGWLQAHSDWLLILDNVEHRADVEPLLGQVADGHILITTRRDVGWEEITDGCLRVEVLDPSAAVELLLKLSSQKDEQTAAVLAGELGCLPLALQQAGAYLRQTRTTLASYLQDLRRDPAQTLGSVAPDNGAERAVARVWSVTLAHIASLAPTAVAVLNVLSWLAPDELPRSVIRNGAINGSEIDHALGVLASYNMITLTEKTVAVHRLVQAIIRNAALTNSTATDIQAMAVGLLRFAMPRVQVSEADMRQQGTALLPHISALAENLPPNHTSKAMLWLQSDAAAFRQRQGDARTAVVEFEQVVSDFGRVFGVDHPDTLATRHRLAHAYESAGRIDEALAEHERVLADYRRVLGEDHPETLTARHGIGRAYQAGGRTDEALAALEQLLVDRRRVLGNDHPDTLVTRHNIARSHRAAGRNDEALAQFEELLSDYRRVFGHHDPVTFRIRSNIADSHRASGRTDVALQELQSILKDQERVLGDDHPDTLATRHGIAHGLDDIGQADEAVAEHEHVLASYERVLGEDHPGTLNARHCLAHAYEALGRIDEAITKHENVLADRIRLLGKDHPSTATARRCVDRAYEIANKSKAAREGRPSNRGID